MEEKGKKECFKIRVAIFFGYNGQEYKGSQIQTEPGIKTVEKEVFEALIASKLVTETNLHQLKKTGLGRGARTDKGVHALTNGVTVKLAITEEFMLEDTKIFEDVKYVQDEKDEEEIQNCEEDQKSSIVDEKKEENTTEVTEIKGDQAAQSAEKREQRLEKKRAKQRVHQAFAEERRRNIDNEKIIAVLNSHLPGDIRVVAVKQVTRKFDIRMMCSSRQYEYLLPVSVFDTPQQETNENPQVNNQQKDAVEVEKKEQQDSGIDQEQKDSNKIVQEQQSTESKDVDSPLLARIQSLASQFKGTHNFHNYTRMMKAKDPKCKRYIIDISVKPFTSTSGKQFFRICLTGQSFIYHQIRKMVGMLVMIVNQNYPDSFLETSFFHNVMNVWLAPAHGLFLNRMLFEGYNRKREIPELIQFDEKEEQRIQEMRKIIEAAAMDDEQTTSIYSSWINLMRDGKETIDDNESISGDGNDG